MDLKQDFEISYKNLSHEKILLFWILKRKYNKMEIWETLEETKGN